MRVVEIVEPDQATEVGLLDGVRIDDPPQCRQLDRLADRQRVDDGADRVGQGADARLDQLDQAVRHDRVSDSTASSRSAVPDGHRRPPARRCVADTGCCPASAATGCRRSAGPSNRPRSPTAAPSSRPATAAAGRADRTRRASKAPVSQPESARRPGASAESSPRLAARSDPERTSTDRRAGAGRPHRPRRGRPTTRQSASR